MKKNYNITTMKKDFFLLSATAVAIIIMGFSACSKTTTNDHETQQWSNQTKGEVLDTVHNPCYTWRYIGHDFPQFLDTCFDFYWIDLMPWYTLCSIDFDCLGLEDPPIAPDDPFSIIIPQYANLDPLASSMYSKSIEKGEIVFREDCPLGNTGYVELLPDGFLPAGAYPIIDRNGDAVIDISSAVKAN